MNPIEKAANPENWHPKSPWLFLIVALSPFLFLGYFQLLDNFIRGPVINLLSKPYASNARGERKLYFKQGDVVYMRLEVEQLRNCPGTFDTTISNNIKVTVPQTRRSGGRRLDKHTLVIPIITVTRAQTPGSHRVKRAGRWDCNKFGPPIFKQIADFEFVVLD